MSAELPGHITVGLQWPRSQARVLRALAERVARRELPGVDPELFDKAATATELGEPLHVVATDRAEVGAMAALFATLGTSTPAVVDVRVPE